VTFLEILWFILISFVFIAYLMVMFSIITDIFRDHEISGVAKAAWLIALIFLPFLTAIVYMVARGGGMAERSSRSTHALVDRQDAYIREVAQTSPADQITQGRALLDKGSITQAEFDRIKEKALA